MSPALETGFEIGRKPSPRTTDVSGGDCWGEAPQLCVGGLGSEAGYRQRHSESPRRQSAAGQCASGRDDGEARCTAKVLVSMVH